uniref:Uncharacterized protein n=1 Tax=Moniliophthora roreri TaxID=221103 RepID=A0A0W0FYH7_MONRR
MMYPGDGHLSFNAG